jgi:hypothetical protein
MKRFIAIFAFTVSAFGATGVAHASFPCRSDIDCNGGLACNIQSGFCCAAPTCAAQGAVCGFVFETCSTCQQDICGQIELNCQSSSCPGGTCIHNQCCIPQTCAQHPEIQCGPVSDGCGGILNCGGCNSPQVCNASTNTCCNETTCAAQGATCGTVNAGCGPEFVLTCGTCGAGQGCSSNHCVTCPSNACSLQGAQCGTITDPTCGVTTCGTCGAGTHCDATNHCAAGNPIPAVSTVGLSGMGLLLGALGIVALGPGQSRRKRACQGRQ